MTAAECLEHEWLRQVDARPPSSTVPPSPAPDTSPLTPHHQMPSVNDSPSGQRRALASTLTDDDDSDDLLSVREPAKKCRCDIDLNQPLADQPSSDSGADKENYGDVEKRLSATTATPSKRDSAETSALCCTPTAAAVAKTLVGGVCIDISVA